MTDILEDNIHRPFLSSSELRNVDLPTVKKGGYDLEITDVVLERAAVTIDGLTLANERLSRERVDQITETDAVVAASTETEPEKATKLLAAAQTIADQMVADAREQASLITAEADATIANMQETARDERDALSAQHADLRGDLEAEIADLEAKRDAKRASITAELERWSEGIADRKANINDSLGQISHLLDAIQETADLEDVEDDDLEAQENNFANEAYFANSDASDADAPDADDSSDAAPAPASGSSAAPAPASALWAPPTSDPVSE